MPKSLEMRLQINSLPTSMFGTYSDEYIRPGRNGRCEPDTAWIGVDEVAGEIIMVV